MKYRAVANGNIVDDVHPSLVEAGIYVAIEDPEEEGPQEPESEVEFTPSEKLDEAVGVRALDTPESPLRNVAHTDADPKSKRRRTRKKKAKE